jgi:hypothetical protein
MPGPGGANGGTVNVATIPGVAIDSGNVYIPSFGGGTGGPTLPKRSHAARGQAPTIMVIASPRSGGALSNYGTMKGIQVYTMYMDSPAGIIVLQFSDPSVKNDMEYGLAPPEPVLTEIPLGVFLPHTVLVCVLGRTGSLHDFRVAKTPYPSLIPPLIQVLERWRFVPALRGKDPISVDVVLGFGVDTID